MRRRIHGQEGATAVEWVAVLAIVATVLAALRAAVPPSQIRSETQRAVCTILTGLLCPPDADGDGVPDDEDPDEQRRDRWRELPCPVERSSDFRSWDLFLPRFFLLAGSGTETVEQVGPDRFRVTVVGENRLGVGSFTGDPPGTRTRRDGQWEPVSGSFNGMGAATLGGRAATTYEFGSPEEAERFLEGRRGGWRGWAAAVTGVSGHVLEELWHHGSRLVGGLWRRVTGQPPPSPEPEPRFYSTGVNPRVSIAAGWNQGRLGGVESDAAGTFDEALTFDRGDRLTSDDGQDRRRFVHTVTVDTTIGGQLFPPQAVGAGRLPVPAAGVTRFYDRSYRYRYISDVRGNPVRLVLAEERGTSTGGSVRSGTTNPGSRPGSAQGGGVSADGRLSDVEIREIHLDLTVPENREAFEGVFLHAGPLAHPKRWALTDAQALAALFSRIQRDGLIAEFEYDDLSGELSAGFARFPGSRPGIWGIFPKTGSSERDLREARYLDRRQDDPRFQPLRSCTEPSTGDLSGISPNTGGSRPPGSP